MYKKEISLLTKHQAFFQQWVFNKKREKCDILNCDLKQKELLSLHPNLTNFITQTLYRPETGLQKRKENKVN